MKNQSIKNIKSQVIDLIIESLNGQEKSIWFDATTLFDCVPMSIPHGSELLDVRIELTVKPTGVYIKVEGEDPDFYDDYDDDDDLEDEGFGKEETFEKLNLQFLALILDKI